MEILSKFLIGSPRQSHNLLSDMWLVNLLMNRRLRGLGSIAARTTHPAQFRRPPTFLSRTFHSILSRYRHTIPIRLFVPKSPVDWVYQGVILVCIFNLSIDYHSTSISFLWWLEIKLQASRGESLYGVNISRCPPILETTIFTRTFYNTWIKAHRVHQYSIISLCRFRRMRQRSTVSMRVCLTRMTISEEVCFISSR
jgi:hypothetical protein